MGTAAIARGDVAFSAGSSSGVSATACSAAALSAAMAVASAAIFTAAAFSASAAAAALSAAAFSSAAIASAALASSAAFSAAAVSAVNLAAAFSAAAFSSAAFVSTAFAAALAASVSQAEFEHRPADQARFDHRPVGVLLGALAGAAAALSLRRRHGDHPARADQPGRIPRASARPAGAAGGELDGAGGEGAGQDPGHDGSGSGPRRRDVPRHALGALGAWARALPRRRMHARAGDDPRAARARYTQRAGAARSAGRRRERRRRERPRRGAQKGSHVPDAGAADVRHAADDQCAAGGGATLGLSGPHLQPQGCGRPATGARGAVR
mmetsp:Transcript_55246/g.164479  ORF Transcript_55246/g.164479 Transcript_55246/m.164479 type:complete len:325 (-) Transcript_55246:1042-2016(-)